MLSIVFGRHNHQVLGTQSCTAVHTASCWYLAPTAVPWVLPRSELVNKINAQANALGELRTELRKRDTGIAALEQLLMQGPAGGLWAAAHSGGAANGSAAVGDGDGVAPGPVPGTAAQGGGEAAAKELHAALMAALDAAVRSQAGGTTASGSGGASGGGGGSASGGGGANGGAAGGVRAFDEGVGARNGTGVGQSVGEEELEVEWKLRALQEEVSAMEQELQRERQVKGSLVAELGRAGVRVSSSGAEGGGDGGEGSDAAAPVGGSAGGAAGATIPGEVTGAHARDREGPALVAASAGALGATAGDAARLTLEQSGEEGTALPLAGEGGAHPEWGTLVASAAGSSGLPPRLRVQALAQRLLMLDEELERERKAVAHMRQRQTQLELEQKLRQAEAQVAHAQAAEHEGLPGTSLADAFRVGARPGPGVAGHEQHLTSHAGPAAGLMVGAGGGPGQAGSSTRIGDSGAAASSHAASAPAAAVVPPVASGQALHDQGGNGGMAHTAAETAEAPLMHVWRPGRHLHPESAGPAHPHLHHHPHPHLGHAGGAAPNGLPPPPPGASWFVPPPAGDEAQALAGQLQEEATGQLPASTAADSGAHQGSGAAPVSPRSSSAAAAPPQPPAQAAQQQHQLPGLRPQEAPSLQTRSAPLPGMAAQSPSGEVPLVAPLAGELDDDDELSLSPKPRTRRQGGVWGWSWLAGGDLVAY